MARCSQGFFEAVVREGEEQLLAEPERLIALADEFGTRMRTSEVAAQARVNPQTLRYYERRGLLPDPARPFVVYCWDGRRDMSPRAACRLETLGFTQVHDYMPGKVDWLARNLPGEGTAADAPTIGRHLRNDVVTAGPDEPIADVRARVAASAHTLALISTADILLGRLRGSHLDHAEATAVVADVMEAGPSTLRPHEPAHAVRARLTDKGLSYAIVTDPDGRLLGTAHPDDLRLDAASDRKSIG